MLATMAGLGVSAKQCLAGTSLQLEDLDLAEANLSLEQEYRIYRNVQQSTDDALIGLKLGQAYLPESYGLLGYAMLSSATMGDALKVAVDFHLLTFSHFTLSEIEQVGLAGIAFSQQYPLPPDLLAIYSDRDTQAAVTGLNASCPSKTGPKLIRLMHDGHGNPQAYEDFFGCPVSCNHYRNEVLFEPAVLNQALPLRDAQSSSYCRQQCQHLIDTLSAKGSYADKVRNTIIATPSVFPSIEQAATVLGTSVRTLRRNLTLENSGYQKLLNEIRFEMAKTYLQSSMPIEHIAERLGYSEAANFSHAFKRICQKTPSQYRQSLTIG